MKGNKEEVMSAPECSTSTPQPTHSSTKIQLKSASKTKKKQKKISAKAQNPKFKPKKVVSSNPGKSTSYKRKRTRASDLYDSLEVKFSVMERAGRVLEILAAEYPSFTKCMLPSNVAHGFWLIFPKKFCNLHLPSHDATVFLVDDWGNEYKTNYLKERHGLSGGWRGFCIAHRLLRGDILIFHLVEPCKLKVRIVRVHGVDEINAALCLMNMDALKKEVEPDLAKNKKNKMRKRAKKCAEYLLLDYPQPQEHFQENDPRITNSSLALEADKSEHNSDGFGSDVLEDSKITTLKQTSPSAVKVC